MSKNSRTIFSRLWDGYINALNRRPLATKVSAATFIFFTSDSITQYLFHTSQKNYGMSLFVFLKTNNDFCYFFRMLEIHYVWKFQCVFTQYYNEIFSLSNYLKKTNELLGIHIKFLKKTNIDNY